MWYDMRQQWHADGLKETVSALQSQRDFYNSMRSCVSLSAENYDDIAEEAKESWRAQHVVVPR